MYPEDCHFNLLLEQALIQNRLKSPEDNSRKLNLPLCLFFTALILLGLVFLVLFNG